MPVRFLLDTNIASYLVKSNVPRVREKLLRIPIADVAISTITEAELRYGIARVPQSIHLKITVEEFLRRVEILPWDSEAARKYAELRAELEREGRPVGNMDLLIASHAMSVDVVLVTHDRSFRKIKGLKTADWTL